MKYYSTIWLLFKSRVICGSLILALGILCAPFLSNGQTISGAGGVCIGATTTLTGTPTGGVWSSSTTSVATVSATGVVTGISSGNSIISYTIGAVTDTQLITVHVNPAVIIGTSAFCSGNTATLTDSTIGGAWSSSNTSVATVGTSGIMNGIAAGTVTMTYTATSGCYTTKTITVNPLPGPISGTLAFCDSGTTTLSIAASGGTWSSSTPSVASVNPTSGVVTGITPGTTKITYTLPTGCATSVIVTINTLPAAITGTFNLCRDNTTTLSDATGGGTWNSSNPPVAAITAGGVVTAIAPGTAVITYTSSSGCIRTAVLTVNPSPAPISGPAAVCVGNYIILSNAVGGGIWSCSSPLASIGGGTGVLTGVSVGYITVSYTLGTGCFITTDITVNPTPSAITGFSAVCIGSAITLADATTGGTWSSAAPAAAAISASGVVTGTATGSTTISYTLATGCYATTGMTVNPLPLPITGPTTVCAGSTISLTDASTGGTWSSGSASIATIGASTGILTGVSAGSVAISYTLSTGCSGSIAITVNPLPASITGIFEMCAGQSTTLSDGTSGGTWSSGTTSVAAVGSTTGIVTGIAGGTANIAYMIGTGCKSIATITINAIPSIGGASSICEGATITLSGTPSGGTWSSSNIAVGTIGVAGELSGISAGTTNITYTSPSGCVATRVMTVNLIPAGITGTMAVCLSSVTSLSSASSGGAWSSSNPSVASVNIISGEVTGMAPGTAIITYTLLTGCDRSTVVTVNNLPTLGGTPAICIGGTTTLTATPTGGTWTSVSPLVTVGASSGVITGITAGTANVTYTLSTGCFTSVIVTISATGTAGVISGSGVICTGGTVSFSSTVSGGTWSSGSTGVATAGLTSGVVTGVSAGTAGITYSISDVCGVVATSTVVTVNTTPVMTGASVVCAGSAITLASSVGCGTWSSISITTATVSAIGGGDTAVVTGVAAGITVITFTSCSGCIATKLVTVNPVPVTITGGPSVCVGDILNLIEPVIGGTWSSSNPPVASVSIIGGAAGVVTGLAAGTATMTYMLATGCYASILITVDPLPAITVSASAAACGGAYTGIAGGGVTYTWLPAAGLSCTSCAIVTLRPAATTTYTVTGTSPAGCVNTATVTVNGNRISGHISFGGAAPAALAMQVWLIRFNPADSSIMALDSTLTCLDGSLPYYQFDSVAGGSYMVKAKLLSSVPGISGYIPTYGGSAADWFAANTIIHASAADTQHIQMIYGTVPAGSGFISGYVYSGAGKGTTGEVPEPHMLVYLKSASTGQVLTYTYTDTSGAYAFNGIALGGYIVYPEEFDYYTTPAIVSLSAAAPGKTHVTFKKHTVLHTIYPFKYAEGIGAIAENAEISLYPNPTSGDITVQWAGHLNGNADVAITDITGRQVYKTTLYFDATGRASVNPEGLGASIYTIGIRAEGMNYYGKLVIEK